MVVLVRLPLVPVIVRVYVPLLIPLEVLTARVDVVVVGLGVKLAVA